MCVAPGHPLPPARPSTGFLKPSSDGEDSGPRNSSVPAWKKSSKLTKSESVEKPLQEKESDAGKAVIAAQDGVRGDKAAETMSRF